MDINVCESCGGKVEFSPQDKALKCENCASLYPIEYNQQIVKHSIDWVPEISKINDWANQNRACKCNICGAQVAFNKYDIAGRCQYCHMDSLVPLKELPGLRPEKIIPFKIAKSQAKDEFKVRILKRKFLPNDFKKSLPRVEIGATYLSSFNFDCFVSAKYDGRQEFTETVTERDGSTRRITEYSYFSGNIERQFNNLVVEASDKLNQDEIREVFPYDFNECYDYDNGFVKGYNVGYYNQTTVEAQEVAKKDALDAIESQIRSKYSSIDRLNIYPMYSNIVYNYTLLPVYFITFSYKNKPYINIMNGQTGKIGGSVPRSATKITLLTLFIILAIGLPILFILLSN